MRKNLTTVCIQSFLAIIFILLAQKLYTQELRPKAVVIKENAVLRIYPSRESPIIKKIPVGTVLQVEKTQLEWLKVKLPPDKSGIRLTGYIHKSFVSYEIDKVPKREEKKEVEVPKEVKPKKPIPPPLPPLKKPLVTERKKEIPVAKRREKLISIFITKGMDNVDGGDLNEMIRDTNRFYSASNTYYDYIDYNCSWSEMRWLHNTRGEIVINVSPKIGIGLGIEYIAATRKGALTQSRNTEDTHNTDLGYYYVEKIDNSSNFEPEYKLRAIPISLSLHLYVPLNGMAAVFFTGGVGYYLGNLEVMNPYQIDYDSSEDYYYDDGTSWRTWTNNWDQSGTYTEKVSSKTVGIHGGIGLDLKITPNISFVAEGNYRYVNFKNWDGSSSDTYDWNKESGWSDEGLNSESRSESESASGKLWYFKVYYGYSSKYYACINVFEEEPTPGTNTRIAKISLNGFTVRAGIKISF